MNIGGTEFKFRSCWKGKTETMILTIVGFLVILILMGILGLMFLGKFSRLQREINELVATLFDEEGFSKIEVIQQFFEVFQTDFKNLKTSFENLQKTSETPEIVVEVLQKFANIETRIANLQETQKGLRQDIDLLFKADDERPVTAVLSSAKPANKGGRPRKESNNA